MATQHSAVSTSRQLTQEQRHQAAYDLITSEIGKNPEDLSLQVELGRLLCYLQREDEALTCLENAWGHSDTAELTEILGTYLASRIAMATKLSATDAPGIALADRFEKLTSLIGFKARSTVSAVLIVKNEEQHLGKCLAALSGKVDQIVVVDTGSTDLTVAIAQEFGATIGEFQWCNDFSAARNASLELATSDWVLWIDADEVVDERSWSPIWEAMIRPHFGGYFLRIVNFTDEHENSTYTHAPIRLFQNRKEIRFTGLIHEQVSPAIDALGLPCAHLNNTTIWHYGYKPSEMAAKSKLDRTISMLQQQVEAEPKEAFHWFNLANAYSVAGQHEEVVQSARTCLTFLAPENAFGSIAYQLLASAHLALNQIDQALAVCQEAKASGHFSVVNQFELAHTLYRAQKFAEALDAIDTCLGMEWPEGMTGDRGIATHKSHVLKGQILTELGRYPKAFECLNYALGVDPHFGLTHFALGNAFERIGQLDSAKEHFRTGSSDRSFGRACLIGLGRVQKTQGDFDKAQESLHQAWTMLRADQEAWALWAQVCEISEDWSACNIAYESFEKTFEPNSVVWVNWGRALEQTGQHEVAESKFVEAVNLDPSSENAVLNLGDFYYRRGRFMDAAGAFEKALALNGENAESWFVLGNTFSQLGIFAGAETAYRQALRIDPNHSKAVHNLSIVTSTVA